MKLIMESWRDFVSAPKIFDMDAGQFWDEVFYTADEILQSESDAPTRLLRDFKPKEHVVQVKDVAYWDRTQGTHRYRLKNTGEFYDRMEKIKDWLGSDKRNIDRTLRTIFVENWDNLNRPTKRLIMAHVKDYHDIASTTHNLNLGRPGSAHSSGLRSGWGTPEDQQRLTKGSYESDKGGYIRKDDIHTRGKPSRPGVTFIDVQKNLQKLDPLAVSIPKSDPDSAALSLPEPENKHGLSIPEDYPKDSQSAKEAYRKSPNQTIKDVDSATASKVVREVATDSSFVRFVNKIPVLSKYLVISFLVLGAQDAWAKGGTVGLAKFTARSGMEFVLGDILTLSEVAEIIRKTSRKESSKMIDQSPIPSSSGRFYNK